MSNETISVHILGKDYQVACPPDESEALIRAATELDRRMKAIRQSGSVIGVERIAVMAALNLSHEVLSADGQTGGSELEINLIDDMCQRVETCLARDK